jgi:hypothetical protein
VHAHEHARLRWISAPRDRGRLPTERIENRVLSETISGQDRIWLDRIPEEQRFCKPLVGVQIPDPAQSKSMA